MAKATFPCAGCGASITVGGSSYNRRRADNYAEFCAKRGDLCEACKRAQFLEDNARAAAETAAIGLEPLKGTEKQIAWANTIRLQMLPRIDAAGVTVKNHITSMSRSLSAEALAELRDAAALLLTEMRAQPEARWWIDYRNDDLADMMVKELQKRGATLAPTAYAELRSRP